MIWEERVLNINTIQLLQIIPQYAALLNRELVTVKIGPGFQEYVLRSVEVYAIFIPTAIDVMIDSIKWLDCDWYGSASVIENHGHISIPASDFLNERVEKVSSILIWSPGRLFPMPCHLPVKSRNGSLVSWIRREE